MPIHILHPRHCREKLIALVLYRHYRYWQHQRCSFHLFQDFKFLLNKAYIIVIMVISVYNVGMLNPRKFNIVYFTYGWRLEITFNWRRMVRLFIVAFCASRYRHELKIDVVQGYLSMFLPNGMKK